MNTSFYNGVNGIKTHQFGIDVWSNNIANIETDGYKNNNPEFSTIFSTALADAYFNPTSNDIGYGSVPQTTSIDLRQGSLKTTDNKYDLALSSEGWFGIQGTDNQILYTRESAYNIDKDGNLVDQNGYYLLGTSGNNITTSILPKNVLDELGNNYTQNGIEQETIDTINDIDDISRSSTDSQTKITLPQNLYYPPVPTTNITIKANLNPETTTDSSGNEIANIEHFTSSVITPEGKTNLLDITFTKEVPQQTEGTIWNGEMQLLSFYEDYDSTKTYDPTQHKVDETLGKVYTIENTQNARVEFSGDGRLVSSNIPTFSNEGQTLNIDIGDIGTYNGLTSVSDSNTVKNIDSNGSKYSFLNGYSINRDGSIIAEFKNGKRVPVAKVAVYHFQNDQGLNRVSSTLLSQSANSGRAFFYKDDNGNDLDTTSVLSNRVETSNTDMTTALTELIVMQNAYDANAQSITTSDQMIQNAINMKK